MVVFALQFDHMMEPTRSSYMNVMLHDAMFFETMIAFSKIVLRHDRLPSQRLTHDILFHISNVLPKLSSRITNSENSQEASIVLTVYYLLVVYQAAGEMEAYRVHLNGLRNLSKTPPIHKRRGFQGFMSARVRSAELVSKFLLDQEQALVNAEWFYDSDYPSEPSPSSSTDEQIPEGFEKLVSESLISTRGVRFLTNINQYLERPYVNVSKDRRTTLLALRMIESIEPTPYPAHMLMFEKPQTSPSYPCMFE